ncbi:hypothetical protein LARV_00467 [Longilinea arvoryzae]|uniref:Uncharacterized protein n=1 Tax=Longilinea arvoryzae TaxID=360412 RepID=A0A0S7BG22_9CHLR|nr:hypothetical protein [Longilinea arvoryzae]GAP12731.1 hypothetical protein LARV_00467 [Longilinea arvoryzae]
MTEQSTLSNKSLSSDKRLYRVWKFIKRNRIHIFILIISVAYLAFAPGIIARYSGKLGKPIDRNITLPAPADKISYSLDSYQEVVIDHQKLQQILGWAFLLEEPDQAKYDKYLVLQSNDRIYYFQYETKKRDDVQAYYENLGLDIVNSGFRAYISADNIQSGWYNIGFVFTGKSGQGVIYSKTNDYLKRTPNSVSINTGILP